MIEIPMALQDLSSATDIYTAQIWQPKDREWKDDPIVALCDTFIGLIKQSRDTGFTHTFNSARGSPTTVDFTPIKGRIGIAVFRQAKRCEAALLLPGLNPKREFRAVDVYADLIYELFGCPSHGFDWLLRYGKDYEEDDMTRILMASRTSIFARPRNLEGVHNSFAAAFCSAHRVGWQF